MSIEYTVGLQFNASGSVLTVLDQTISKLDVAQGAVDKFTTSLKSGAADAVDQFTGLVEKIGLVTVGFLSMGAAFATSKIHEGVTSLNAELEATRLSMASIFYNTGATASFTDGLKLAGYQIDKMRQDAKRLPGEFSDLALIMRTIAAPAGNAGLSADRTREMAAQFMAAGSVANLPMAMVAREAAMLMGGRSGGHNVLGMQAFGLAGSKAHEFNAMGQTKQIDFLTEKLAKFKPAIDSYADSFKGLTSTLSDNLHITLQMVTAPLFEKVKGTLKDINAWFETNQNTVTYWGHYIGQALGHAWDIGISKAHEWGIAALHFANEARNVIVSTWEAVEPVVAHVAEMVKSALGDGNLMSSVRTLLELYTVAKMAPTVLGGAMSFGKTVSKFGGMDLGGGSAMAALAAQAGITTTSLAAGGVAIGVLATAALAAAGELSAIADKNSVHHDDAVQAANHLTSAMTVVGDGFHTNILPTFEAMGVAVTNFTATLLLGVNDLIHIRDTLRTFLNHTADSAFYTYDPSQDRGLGDKVFGKPQLKEDSLTVKRDDIYERLDLSNKLPAIIDAARDKKEPPKPPHVTVNAKVQITVTSNQDPMRIARMVKNEFLGEMRHPKFSGAPNFMNPR